MSANDRLSAGRRDADAFADQQCSGDHPGRRYRRRGGHGSVWLIRRQGRAYLRTLGQPCAAGDEALRRARVKAARPELDPPSRNRLTRAARQAEATKSAGRSRADAGMQNGGE